MYLKRLLHVVLLGLTVCACGRGKSTEDASASGCIRAMSTDSREGRVEDYLDCFTGELRAKLEQARDQMKPGEFAQTLRRRSAPVRGIAIYDQTEVDDKTTRLKVEWVFEDRNEIQTFTLRKVKGAWKISDMTESEFKKPEIPYGTKVYDESI